MFDLTDTISIFELEGGKKSEQISETIKGGFPRIKICDKEFIKKINERRPREFSNTNILKIKDILEKKKNIQEINPLFNLLSDSTENVVVISGGDNEKKNKKINGISIDTIIGKK
jgi:hypothetical protein